MAIKNANSSFFGWKPFCLILPDFGGLYGTIGAWIDRHRHRLIGPAEHPGTFFVIHRRCFQVSPNLLHLLCDFLRPLLPYPLRRTSDPDWIAGRPPALVI